VQLLIAMVIGTVLFFGLTLTAQAYTWYTYNGHEYAITNNWESWVAAEAEAVLAGGHLVTINDAAENYWVAETFKDYYIQGQDSSNPWAAAVNIGYYQDDNQWKWISGETSTYTNRWTDGWDNYTSPHAYLHTNNHPLAATWNHAAWHTEEPTDGALFYGFLKGVIEKSATTGVPEPATMLFLGLGLVGLAGVRRKIQK